MLHKHSAAFNTGTVNSVTLNSAALKNAISNSGIFTVQHWKSATPNSIILQWYNIK